MEVFQIPKNKIKVILLFSFLFLKSYGAFHNQKIVYGDSCQFFKPSFLKNVDKSNFIVFYCICIESQQNRGFILNKVQTIIKDEWCNPSDKLNKVSSKLFDEIDSICFGSHTDYNEILKKYDLWKCDDRFIINYANNLKTLSDNFFLEEVLFNYSKTKNIYLSYIDPKKQYWGSISPNDFCIVYYKVLSQLNISSEIERKKFFKYLYKKGLKTIK